MTFSALFLYSMTALLSDLTALYCLLMFFSWASDGEMMLFHFPLFLLCGAVALLANCILARKERPLPFVAAINGLIGIMTPIVMFMGDHSIRGILPHMIATVFFLYPAPRALSLCLHPVRASTMLKYAELSAAGTGFLILAQVGPFQTAPMTNELCVAALGLNLLALSLLRTRGVLKTRKGKGSTRIQRILILTAAVALLCLLTLLLGIVLPGGRNFVFGILGAVKQGAADVFELIRRFMAFLISLLPDRKSKPIIAPPLHTMELPANDEMTRQALPPALLVAGIAIALTAAAVLLIWILVRLRRARLGSVLSENITGPEQGRTLSVLFLLRAALKRLADKASFRWRVLIWRNTFQGVYALLEIKGKRWGVPREKGQTLREYLMLLGKNAGEGDEEVSAALSELAQAVERSCFQAGQKTGCQRMDPVKARLLLGALKPKRAAAPKPGK